MPIKRKHPLALPAAKLRLRASAKGLSAAKAPAADAPLLFNQERARRAIDFALNMKGRGYHLYVAGVEGTGKHSTTRRLIEKRARREPVPPDLLYVHNFRMPDRPTALQMPAGQGKLFVEALQHFTALLRDAVPRTLESKEHEEQKQALLQRFQKRREEVFDAMEADGERLGFRVKRSEGGIAAFPLKDGEPITPADFEKLSPEERTEIEARQKALNALLREHFRNLREIERQAEEDSRELDRYVLGFVLEPQLESLRRRFGAYSHVGDWLTDLEQDIKNNFGAFMAKPGEEDEDAGHWAAAEGVLRRYQANLVVDNSAYGEMGAPVIRESNPSYVNLFGRIEKIALMGSAHTDFTLIKAGSLFQANGGYLLMNVEDILRNPFAWNAFKSALIHREAFLEDVAEMRMPVALSALRPEPVPLRVRVVLFGNPMLFHLLYAHDEAFRKTFKVRADFEPDIDRSASSQRTYARFLHHMAACEEGFLPLEDSGVEALIEFGSRLAEHQGKLSLRLAEVADLARESSHWARGDGAEHVERAHVERALAEREDRFGHVAARLREEIADGTIMISVRGTETGQVNGISVYDFGHYAFARPVRITAATHMGEGGVVDIERRVKLSGSAYDKGVLILSGFLGERFARDKPLALHTSITFEQNYSEVDGDSASLAELAVILSSLAHVPLRQGVAVTGSINQKGQTQAVGGINEKIEGYYEVCKLLGLTGEQGVVIPRANARHLMLKPEVVEAVRKGRFHVWAVSHADEAMEILSGLKAGRRGKNGKFPSSSLNGRVDKALLDMALALRNFGAPPDEHDRRRPPFRRGGKRAAAKRRGK